MFSPPNKLISSHPEFHLTSTVEGYLVLKIKNPILRTPSEDIGKTTHLTLQIMTGSQIWFPRELDLGETPSPQRLIARGPRNTIIVKEIHRNKISSIKS